MIIYTSLTEVVPFSKEATDIIKNNKYAQPVVEKKISWISQKDSSRVILTQNRVAVAATAVIMHFL